MATKGLQKVEFLAQLENIGKSVEDIAYYRLSYYGLSLSPTLKGRIENFFDAQKLLEGLDNSKYGFDLAVVVFKDNTWLPSLEDPWIYYSPPSYDELMQ